LREQAGLTLAELAQKSGYSIGTINGLELKGEGSQRLKDRLTEILTPLANKESVNDGRTESVTPHVAKKDSAEYKTAAEWKQIAHQLQEENNRLRGAIQLLAAPGTPLSSAAIAKAEDLAREILRRSKLGSQPGDAGSNSKAA